MSIIGIVLGVVAIGLFIWLNNLVKKITSLLEEELDNTHQGMNAIMDDFNSYQLNNDRTIAELKKQIEIKSQENERKIMRLTAELPVIIRKAVGHIEFAQPLDKK